MNKYYIGIPVTFDSGIFDNAVMLIGRPKVILNWAFNPGSSKQGNVFRAPIGSNFVAIIVLKGKCFIQLQSQKKGRIYFTYLVVLL